MMEADLRPGARNMTAYLEASPGGASPVQDAFRAGNEGLEAAAGRIGGGSVQTPEAIGTTIQDAGRRMIDRTRRIKNDLYADAERLAPTTTVRSQNAVDAIDRNIAQLSETPNANRGLLSLLQDSLLGGGAGYAAGGGVGAAVGAVGVGAAKAGALNLSARLLTHPQFVAWLGRAPTNATSRQITAHVRQLGNMAIRQPAIRGEIGQLQRMLRESTTARSIASEGEGGNQEQAYGNQARAAGR